MKIAECYLKSKSPYSQSRPVTVEKMSGELPDDYEKRTWRERIHTDKEGNVFIPPMQFSLSLKLAAQYLSISIPGKGSAKFTKNFESGVLVVDGLSLGIKKNEVPFEKLFVPSDGKSGGGKRVWKYFPLIHQWEGIVNYIILDDIITQDVFEKVLIASGQFIGLGRFRPRNKGYYGRFNVEDIKWTQK